MSTQYKTIVQDLLKKYLMREKQRGRVSKNFVTPDIIYHGMAEEVRGLEEFKKWVAEDLSAFPDMQVTILDDSGGSK